MKKQLMLIAFAIMFITLVSAVPPVTQLNTEGGLSIEYPKYQYVKKDMAFNLHFHVFNTTDIITNATADCYLRLYNITGSHIAKLTADYDLPHDFEIAINSNNFSIPGEYAYIIYCDGAQAGFASGGFTVTNSGLAPAETNFEIFIYILFIITFAGLFYTLLLGLAKLATAETTIYDIIVSWGFYLLLIITYMLAYNFLLFSWIETITDTLLTVTAFTNILLPLFAFFITFFIKSTQKKRPLTPAEIAGRRLS